MEMQHFINNRKLLLEYYSNNIHTAKSPVIISMGNWEPAFRGFPLMNSIHDRRCVVISYRGRGNSSTPKKGWDWKNHANDLELLVKKEKIEQPVFIAFSKGVSYTLGYLERRPEIASGVILIDYPAIHASAEKGYAKFWYTMKYREFHLKDHIRLKALQGIENESTEKTFYGTIKKLECPIEVFVGRNSSSERPSNISDKDIENYRKANKRITFKYFYESGHMILDEELDKACKEISVFLNSLG